MLCGRAGCKTRALAETAREAGTTERPETEPPQQERKEVPVKPLLSKVKADSWEAELALGRREQSTLPRGTGRVRV